MPDSHSPQIAVPRVVLIISRAHGAYEILDNLRTEGLGSQPPVSYRALEFLVKNGFAHKIDTWQKIMPRFF